MRPGDPVEKEWRLSTAPIPTAGCHAVIMKRAKKSFLFLFRRSSMASRFHSGPPDDFNDPGADDALFFESLFEEAEREVRSVRQVRSSRSDAVAGKAKPEEQSFRRRASAEPNRASDSVNSASARYSRSRTAAFGSASMGVSRTRSVSGRPAVSPFMPPPVYPKEPPSLMSVMAAERGESVPAFEGTAALMNRASPDREGAIEEETPL